MPMSTFVKTMPFTSELVADIATPESNPSMRASRTVTPPCSTSVTIPAEPWPSAPAPVIEWPRNLTVMLSAPITRPIAAGSVHTMSFSTIVSRVIVSPHASVAAGAGVPVRANTAPAAATTEIIRDSELKTYPLRGPTPANPIAPVEAQSTGKFPTMIHDFPGQPSESELREQAIRSLKKKQDLRSHVVAYVLVNLLLVGIWIATGAGFFWPIFPIIGWGIAVLFN